MVRRTPICIALAILLPITSSTISCKKKESSSTQSPGEIAEAIRALRPCLRLQGHEGDIVSDYGVPLNGLVVFGVKYRAGTDFPPLGFLDDVRKHLTALGWRPLEYSLDHPPRLVGDGSNWTEMTTEHGVHYFWSQPWAKDDQLLLVMGQYFPTVPQDSDLSVGVYLTVNVYKPDHAKANLANYARAQEQLSGGAEQASTPNDRSP